MMKILTIALCFIASLNLFASENDVEITLDKEETLSVQVEAIYSSSNYLCKKVGLKGRYTLGLHNKVKTVKSIVKNNKILVPSKISSFCLYELHSMTLKFLNQLVPSSERISYISVKEAPRGSYGILVKNCRLIENSNIKAKFIFPMVMDCYGDVITLDDENKAEVKVNINY